MGRPDAAFCFNPDNDKTPGGVAAPLCAGRLSHVEKANPAARRKFGGG